MTAVMAGLGLDALATTKDYDEGLLLSITNQLGSVQEVDGRVVYVADEDCLACLGDMARFLRRDNPKTREVVLALSAWNVMRAHIVPIILQYNKEHEMLLAATKIAVFLTLSSEPEVDNAAEQLQALQRCKAQFLNGAALTAVTQLIAAPLARFAERGRMPEPDWKLVQLVLTLYRNLLVIPDPRPTSASGNDHLTRLRDSLIARLFKEDIAELLLIVAQESGRPPFKNEGALLLEIFHELFRGHSAEALVEAVERQKETAALIASGTLPAHAAKKDHEAAASLKAALAAEKSGSASVLRGAPTRHGRFGGMYVRQTGSGGSAFVRSNPTAAAVVTTKDKVKGGAFGRSKPRLVGPQKVMADENNPGNAPFASTDVKVSLHGLADGFTKGPYNVLMGGLLGDITLGRAPSLSEHEVKSRTIHFMRLKTFCLQFVRLRVSREQREKERLRAEGITAELDAIIGADDDKPSDWGCVSDTMDQRAFHWMRMEWLRVAELKKEEKAVAAAGAALKEMLSVLELALNSPNERDVEVAKALALQVLTEDSADEGILSNLHKLLKKFDPKRYPRAHMATLTEAVDIVLRLLKQLADMADGCLYVKRKGRGKGRKKKKDAEAAERAAAVLQAAREGRPLGGEAPEGAAERQEGGDGGLEDLEDAPEEGGDGGARRRSGARTIDDGTPENSGAGAEGAAAGGDAGAGAEGESGAPPGAEGARGEGGAAGARDGAEEDGGEDMEERMREAGIDMDVAGDGGAEGEAEAEDEEGEDAGEAQRKGMKQVKLDLPRRIARLADPQTVCNYVWVLKGWRTNSAALNAIVVGFLRRLEELGIERMLHQVSVLMVLHDIVSDPAAKADARFHDVFRFARGIVRGVFARLCPEPLRRRRPAADGGGWEPVPDEDLEPSDRARRAAARIGFLDLCFWKTRGQAIQMDFDSGLDFPPPAAAAAGAAAKRAGGPVLHQGMRALCEDDEEADADGTVVGVDEKKHTKQGLFTFAQADLFKELCAEHEGKEDMVDIIIAAMADKARDQPITLARDQALRQINKFRTINLTNAQADLFKKLCAEHKGKEDMVELLIAGMADEDRAAQPIELSRDQVYRQAAKYRLAKDLPERERKEKKKRKKKERLKGFVASDEDTEEGEMTDTDEEIEGFSRKRKGKKKDKKERRLSKKERKRARLTQRLKDIVGAGEGEGRPVEEGDAAAWAAAVELPAPGASLPDLDEPCTPLASKALAALLAAAAPEGGADPLDAEATVAWVRRKLSAPIQLWGDSDEERADFTLVPLLDEDWDWSEHALSSAVLRSLALRQPQPGKGQPNWRVPGRGGAWAKRVLASFEAALEAARKGEVAAPLDGEVAPGGSGRAAGRKPAGGGAPDGSGSDASESEESSSESESSDSEEKARRRKKAKAAAAKAKAKAKAAAEAEGGRGKRKRGRKDGGAGSGGSDDEEDEEERKRALELLEKKAASKRRKSALDSDSEGSQPEASPAKERAASEDEEEAAPSGRKSIGSQGLRSRLANKRREEEDAGDDGLLEGLSDSEGAGAGAAAARLLDSDSEDEPAAAAPSSAGGKAGSPGSSGGGAQGRAASESPAPRAEAAEKPAAAGGGGRRTLLDDDSDDEAAALEVSPAADAAAKPKKNVLDSDSDADE